MKKKNFYPPGMDIRKVKYYYGIAITISLIWSFFFIGRCSEIGTAFDNFSGFTNYALNDFKDMVFPYMAGFILVIIVSILLIPYFYGYFYRGSKSIYTMKRLKNPMEIHMRALFYPVIFTLTTTIIGLLCLKVYYNLYLSLGEKISQ